MARTRPSRRDDFEIAAICALRTEYDAVTNVFDEFWDENEDTYGRADGDSNQYTTGRVGNHNVVLVLLPGMGKVNAVRAATGLQSSYKRLRLALLVGVCGGMPRTGSMNICLGDVIVSKRIVQYDFGRQYPDGFARKDTVEDSLGRSNPDVRALLALFETELHSSWLKSRTAHHLDELRARSGRGRYDYPGVEEDKLFQSTYRHKHHISASCICKDCAGDTDPVCDEALKSACEDLGCETSFVVARDGLSLLTMPRKPVIHFGAIASADTVLKSASHRDKIGRDSEAIAFEMEGAGVWDELPSIVIKSVCDYADSHKQKSWQNYAAATAASAFKAFLERYTLTDRVPVSHPSFQVLSTETSIIPTERTTGTQLKAHASVSGFITKDKLSLAIMAFENALKAGSQAQSLVTLFNNLRTRRQPEMEDATRLANDLAYDCAKRHRQWYAHATNTVIFLEHLQRLFVISSPIIKGTQYPTASSVWAAVRLTLESAVPFLTLFDKLTQLLLRCGKVSKFRVDASHQISASHELRCLANEYLAIAVQISTDTIKHVFKSTFMQMTSTFIANFESNFGLSEKQLEALDLNMRRYSEVAISESSSRQLTARTSSMTPSAQSIRKAGERITKRQRFLRWLCANPEGIERAYRQYRRKANSRWLFSHKLYEDWTHDHRSGCLWLRGKLGSGKSIVLASAIANLRSKDLQRTGGLIHPRQAEPNINKTGWRESLGILNPGASSPRTLSFYFVTTLRPATLKATTLLGCVAYQILASTPMADYLRRYLDRTTIHNNGLSNAGAIVDILLDATPQAWIGYIVIDGFDSYSKEEATIIIKELKRLQTHRTVKMICSSRTNWELIDKASLELGHFSTLNMDEVDRSSEIDSFISEKMGEWRSIRSLTSEQEDLIRRQLMLWNGMFLWLNLQVEFISSDLHSDMTILEIWRNLPTELPQVFDRALLQLSDQSLAVKIHKLVAASEEPLTLNELQAAANVIPGSNHWDPIHESSTSFLWRYGGHLLELDVEGDTVGFIHDSARGHVLRKEANPKAKDFHFDIAEARQLLADVIITYLTYPAFEGETTSPPETTSAMKSNKVFQVPQHVVSSVLAPQPWIQKMFGRVGGSRKIGPLSIDMQSLLQDLDVAKARLEKLSRETLLNYAKTCWLAVAKMASLSTDIRVRWSSIMRGHVSIIEPPFRDEQIKIDPRTAISWALCEGHSMIFDYCMSLLGERHFMKIASDAIYGTHEGDIQLRGSSLRPVLGYALSLESSSEEKVAGTLVMSVIKLIFRRHPWDEHWLGDLTVQRETEQLQRSAPEVMLRLIRYSTMDEINFDHCCGILKGYMNLNETSYHQATPLQYVFQLMGSATAKRNAILRTRVRMLLKHGATPDSPSQAPGSLSPLLQASQMDDGEMMGALLEHGASINQVDSDGANALEYALRANNSDGVVLLLTRTRQINWNWRTRLYGETALHLAVMSRNGLVIQALIEFTDIRMYMDLKDNAGRTALHYACNLSAYNIIEALVKAGAKTQEEDNKGNTPWSILCGDSEEFNPELSQSTNEKLVTRKSSLC